MSPIMATARRIACVAVLMASCVGIASAQDRPQPSVYTGNMANGRYWKMLDFPAKVLFTRGIDDGIAFFTLEMNLLKILDAKTTDIVANEYNPASASYEELIQQIDAFYADAANANLPIVYARLYTVRKMNGYTPKELQDYAAALRQMFNNLPGNGNMK